MLCCAWRFDLRSWRFDLRSRVCGRCDRQGISDRASDGRAMSLLASVGSEGRRRGGCRADRDSARRRCASAVWKSAGGHGSGGHGSCAPAGHLSRRRQPPTFRTGEANASNGPTGPTAREGEAISSFSKTMTPAPGGSPTGRSAQADPWYGAVAMSHGPGTKFRTVSPDRASGETC